MLAGRRRHAGEQSTEDEQTGGRWREDRDGGERQPQHHKEAAEQPHAGCHDAELRRLLSRRTAGTWSGSEQGALRAGGDPHHHRKRLRKAERSRLLRLQQHYVDQHAPGPQQTSAFSLRLPKLRAFRKETHPITGNSTSPLSPTSGKRRC